MVLQRILHQQTREGHSILLPVKSFMILAAKYSVQITSCTCVEYVLTWNISPKKYMLKHNPMPIASKLIPNIKFSCKELRPSFWNWLGCWLCFPICGYSPCDLLLHKWRFHPKLPLNILHILQAYTIVLLSFSWRFLRNAYILLRVYFMYFEKFSQS